MRQIEHFGIMANNNEICILRTLEYTKNGTSETFNIGTNGEDYGAELTREQMRELWRRIGSILGDVVEDVQPENEKRQPCPRGLKGIERAAYLIDQKNKQTEQAKQESRF